MSRRLNKLAGQVSKNAWKRINETRKLAKSEQTNPQDLFDAFLSDYKIKVVDKDNVLRIGEVLQSLWSVVTDIAGTGQLVSDAINSYSLMEIQLFNGMTLPRECCYAGGMADYEQDEATLYLAAERALNIKTKPLQIGAGNICTDFRSVVAHEIGHLVMPFAEDMLGEKFAITYDMYPQYYWEKEVSKYAGTSDHELFGEAFAAYTHPDYGQDGNLIPAMLEAIFVKVGIVNGGAVTKISRNQNAKPKKSKSQTAVDIITDDGTMVAATKINDIIDSVEDADWFELEGDISPALMSAFKDAGYTEIAGTASAGDETLFNAVNKGAEEYAESHSAELVTNIKESTRNMLRGTIEDAIKEGWSQPELAEEIANSYGFSESRADLISSQELGVAYSRGRIDAAEGAGATKKRSLLSADHDDAEDCDCTDAADAGAVDFDESFTDDPDYDFPPYHVRCQCDWVGVYPGDEDDDELDAGDEEGEDEEHGKFAKRVLDNDPEDYVLQELSPEETAENQNCMDLAGTALELSSPDDITGQRISGKADARTRVAVTNYENAGGRSSDHRGAYEFHTEAALHYKQMGNDKSQAAHQNCADAHKKIMLRLEAESQVEKVAIDNMAHEAATSPRNDLDEPSEEQKHAGNYKKGHFVINGVPISIENPAGSRRRAGWQTLKAHYGYIKLTEGADGDHIDVFVREGTQDTYEGPVYVIDQYIDGSFDEHKIMIGWVSKQKACAAYLGSYQAGWKLGPVTKLGWKVFREWVEEQIHTEPIKTDKMV